MYLITFYIILIAFGFIVDCFVPFISFFFLPKSTHIHRCAARAHEYYTFLYTHSIFIISAVSRLQYFFSVVHSHCIARKFFWRKESECAIQPKGKLFTCFFFFEHMCRSLRCGATLFIIFEILLDAEDENYLMFLHHIYVYQNVYEITLRYLVFLSFQNSR